MEDVLAVYHRPDSEAHPTVCIDETSKQQIKETRVSQPAHPGYPHRYDDEYERNGVSHLFMLSAPFVGWRHVHVTDRRTKLDVACVCRDLVDVHFPTAETITVVVDTLKTHTPASLYAAFEPAEARRIVAKLDVHYTPKHGSWLNMAEIELSVVARQCLACRIPDQDTLKREVAVWEEKRHAQSAKIAWRFTTEDARIKLKRLYPSI